ncbi:MAG: hypothetical protein WCK89_14855 [bacterium]
MTADETLRQIETGGMPVDTLRLMVQILAQQKDPAAPDLLIYIGKNSLWRRWGFASLDDFIVRTRVPEAVLRCIAVYLLLEELDKPYMRTSSSAEARMAIIRLFEDRPLDIDHDEFSGRRQQALDLLEGCRSVA